MLIAPAKLVYRTHHKYLVGFKDAKPTHMEDCLHPVSDLSS